jgi:MFS family permease
MLMDYVDRQVVVSMFPLLRQEWNLSDTELGMLASIVPVTVAAATLPLSFLVDRWGRVNSMALMALVWSAATIACAFARDYSHLLVLRGIVGLGEAAYGTAGAALLATLFRERVRSTVLGAFLSAALVGSVVGVALGGVVSQRYGWPAAFGLVGAPGVVLAIMLKLFVRDYPSVALPAHIRSDHGLRDAARAVAVALRTPRSLPLICLGGSLQLVVVASIYSWLPSYFHRMQGLAPDRAALSASIVVLVSGVGAMLWSVVADRLGRHAPRARLLVPAVAALLCAAVMSLAFGALGPGRLQYSLVVAGAVFMTGSIGPAPAAVMDVVHPSVRATAAAVFALVQNLIGLALGPLLTGILSDAKGLSFAMAVLPSVGIPASVAFFFAARGYPRDVARAITPIPRAAS